MVHLPEYNPEYTERGPALASGQSMCKTFEFNVWNSTTPSIHVHTFRVHTFHVHTYHIHTCHVPIPRSHHVHTTPRSRILRVSRTCMLWHAPHCEPGRTYICVIYSIFLQKMPRTIQPHPPPLGGGMGSSTRGASLHGFDEPPAECKPRL